MQYELVVLALPLHTNKKQDESSQCCQTSLKHYFNFYFILFFKLNCMQVSTFGRTGTISASGITNDRNTVLMFMSATSEDVSNSSTDAELPFLQTQHNKENNVNKQSQR